MSRKNVIPEFNSEPASIAGSLRIAKELIEALLGRRTGQGQGAPFMFYQTNRPDPRRGVELRMGDLWINPNTNAMSYWNGFDWKPTNSE